MATSADPHEPPLIPELLESDMGTSNGLQAIWPDCRRHVDPTLPPDVLHLDGNIKSSRYADTGSIIHSCALDASGSMLAVGSEDGVVRVYMTCTGELVHILKEGDTPKSMVTGVKFVARAALSEPHILIALYLTGEIRHWQVSSKTCISTIRMNQEPFGLDYSGAGAEEKNKFVVCGSMGIVKVYDEETKAQISQLEPSAPSHRYHERMDGHSMRTYAVRFTPDDSNILVSAGWDNTVQIWDIRASEHSIGQIVGPHICGDALDFDTTGRLLLTGSWRRDQTLQLWDFRQRKLNKTFQPIIAVPKCQIYAAMYIKGYRGEAVVYGGSQYNEVRIVDPGLSYSIARVWGFEKSIYAIATRPAPDGLIYVNQELKEAIEKENAPKKAPKSKTSPRFYDLEDSPPPKPKKKRPPGSVDFGPLVICSGTKWYLFKHKVM